MRDVDFAEDTDIDRIEFKNKEEKVKNGNKK